MRYVRMPRSQPEDDVSSGFILSLYKWNLKNGWIDNTLKTGVGYSIRAGHIHDFPRLKQSRHAGFMAFNSLTLLSFVCAL